MGSTVRTSTDTPSRVTRRHQPTETDPISYTITEALAAAEDVPVTELEMCLADHIEIDALDALFDCPTDGGTAVSLSFTLDEYTVHVEESGRITVAKNQ